MTDDEGFDVVGYQLGVSEADQAEAAIQETLQAHGLRFAGHAIVTAENVQAGGPALLQLLGKLAVRAGNNGRILTLIAFEAAGGIVAPIFVEVEGAEG